MLRKTIIFISIIILVLFISIVTFPYFKSPTQIGGGRAAIFSRFFYRPQYPFMSKLDTVNFNLFSKTYNKAGPLKIIVGRPYRYYRMPDGNWGYPWHFPEPANRPCLKLASIRCHEDPVILIKTRDKKLGGLGVTAPKDIIHSSRCFDSVYTQCSKGVDPLLIQGRGRHSAYGDLF